jgi:hypothetical protein
MVPGAQGAAQVNPQPLSANCLPVSPHLLLQVFGKAGAYACMFEERKTLTAAEFADLAESSDHQPPSRGEQSNCSPHFDAARVCRTRSCATQLAMHGFAAAPCPPPPTKERGTNRRNFLHADSIPHTHTPACPHVPPKPHPNPTLGAHTAAHDDDMLERAFWRSVTMSPALYGADTPLSLFGE